MSRHLGDGIRISLFNIAANAVLATCKLVTGLVGNSYALVADAVESFADIASSAIVWSGLRVAARPPDDNHPYGHGRAESLAALAVGVMLVGAAIGIGVQAVSGIHDPHDAPAAYTLIVLGVVVLVKEILYRITLRIGERLGSTAVCADAYHHRSDAITSLIAAVGIAAALYGGAGYEAADEWAALLASGVIAFNGVRFSRRAVLELMDTHPGSDFMSAVLSTAKGVDGVLGVEKILARKMGTEYLVDMHIEVSPELTVRAAHAIAHRVKNAVCRGHDRIADVLIHIEPAKLPKSGSSVEMPV